MADDVNIKINTEADLKGTEAAKKGLKEVAGEAREANVNVATTADQAAQANANVATTANQAAQATRNVGDVAKQRADEGKLDAKSIVHGWMEEAKAAVETKGKIEEATASTGSLAEAFEKVQQSGMKLGGVTGVVGNLSKVVGMEAAAIGGYFAAVAKAADWAYEAVSGTLDGYQKVIAEMEAAGKEVTPELKQEVEAWQNALKPITGTIGAVKSAWENLKEAVSNPVDYFSGLGEFKQWQKESAEFLEFAKNAQKQFLDARYETMRTTVIDVYEDEARALERHLTLQRQINAARQELGDVAAQRARNQVTIAQQDGGDVAAAEANVVLVSLTNALEKLRNEVASAKGDVEQASTELSQAKMLLNTAIQENRPDEEIKKLEDIATEKENAFDIAEQALANQMAVFKEKAALAGENAEIDLVNLQDKYQGAYTDAARKGFEAIQVKLQEAQGLASGATIAQIEALKTQVASDQKATAEAAKAVSLESANKAQKAVQQLANMGDNLNTQLSDILGAVSNVQKQLEGRDRVIKQLIDDNRRLETNLSQFLSR
jgi:hypothetical protein